MSDDRVDLTADGWEFELLALNLERGFQLIADLRAAYWSPTERSLDPDVELSDPSSAAIEVIPFLEFAQDLTGSVVELISTERVEAAVGAPGEPGSVEEIDRFAVEVLGKYAEMLWWSLRLRTFRGPGSITDCFRAISRLLRQPIQQYEEFIYEAIENLRAAAAYSRDPSGEAISKLVVTLEDFGLDPKDTELAEAATQQLVRESQFGIDDAESIRTHSQIADELAGSAWRAVALPGDLKNGELAGD